MLKKKGLSVLMAGVCVIGLLGGCGGNSKEKPTEGPEAGAEKRFDITVVRYDWADKEKMLEGFVKETEEEAGITVDWKVYLNSEWQDKKSVILTNDDLPDAFFDCLTLEDISKNKNLFLPLEDLIEENMPNLSKIFEEKPEVKAYSTSSDGHIYGLPHRKMNSKKVRFQMFINQTWLDNLGLDMPDTWKEYEEVLTAFKEQDANGNGDPNDEIPYGDGTGNAVNAFILPFQHSGQNGGNTLRDKLDNTYYFMTLEDGEPVFMPSLETYRDGIRWMGECYAKGLIDPELFTQDESMRSAKSSNEEIPIVGSYNAWTPGAVSGTWADQYVAMPALAGPDGQRNINSTPEMGDIVAETFWITKNCEDPAALLSWIDKFYTDDATVQLSYGSFGVGTKKNDDGTYTVITPPEGIQADSWAWKNSFKDFGPKFGSDTLLDRVTYEVETEGDGMKFKLMKDLEPYAKPEFPRLRYTDEELSTLSTYYPDLDSYAKTMLAKWVTEGGIDEEWDGYLKTLEQMQLKKVEETVKSAYSRFKGEN